MNLGVFIVGFIIASLLYDFFIKPLASHTYTLFYYLIYKNKIDAYYKEISRLASKKDDDKNV